MQIISEGPIRITKATVDAAWRRRKPATRLILRDHECRGLALIVNPTTMTWSYSYRPRGNDPATCSRWPNRAVTLGNPATHSHEDARTEANRIKGQAAAGADPAMEKKARAAEEQRKRGATLGRLLEEYGRALPKRPKRRGTGAPSPDYIAEELAQTRMAVKEMKAENTPVTDLTEANIRALLAGAVGQTTARKRFGPLSRFLDWCQDLGHIQVNPCTLLARSRRPKTPQARSHYLAPAQLATLWHAAERLREPVWRDLVRFLIAVPCRRGEATRLDWSHLDLTAAEWRQPDHMTKNGDPHRLHLHPLALDVLNNRGKGSRSGLVFPAPRSGEEIDTFTRIKAAMAAAIQPEDGPAPTEWTWHDMRRSFASALGEAGIPEMVADAVLNHRQAATRGGVLGVYQRSSRWPEQMRAMELWGRLLSAAINGETGNVVPLPRSA